jgi:hypothetical protein
MGSGHGPGPCVLNFLLDFVPVVRNIVGILPPTLFAIRSVRELDHGSPCRGAFWNWLWGITGALIAIPLTAALIIVCQNFPSTRWLAILLSKAIEASNRGPNARKGSRVICILCGSHAFNFKTIMFPFELQCRKPKERETMGV